MSETVWISQVRSDSRIGNKQGIRAKFYGDEWEPAELKIPVPSERILAAHRRQRRGLILDRTEMTEAVAIWDGSRFARKGDLFYAGPFMAVRGKLAKVLADFDLGAGGLVPLPVFKADLKTRVEGEFFLLNFGGQKDTFLADASKGIIPFYTEKNTSEQVWKLEAGVSDDDLALSPHCLEGPDLWCERRFHDGLFMSDTLVSALREAKVKVDFRLNSCRIVKG